MYKRYVERIQVITDEYKKIVIFSKDASVNIEPTEEKYTKTIFFEKKRNPYKFTINQDTLIITPEKTKVFNLFRIGVDQSKISLYIPKSTIENLSITSNVGKVDINSITSEGNIDIQTNTGKINLKDVTCKKFESKGNTGSIFLKKVTAKESIFIKRNTGKVELNNCISPEIFIKNNTGKVCGALPSNTVFVTHTKTGQVEIPTPSIGELVGGRCEIRTNTCSINFE